MDTNNKIETCVNQDIMRCIRGFTEYLKSNSYSENTIKSYGIELNLYYKWQYNNVGMIRDLKRDDILLYKRYLKESLRQNAKTINHKLSVLKRYNEYLIDIGKMVEIVIIKRDMIKVQTEYLNPTDVEKWEVMEFLSNLKKDNNLRNYAMAYLLACTGLRVQEMACIELEDVNLSKKEIVIHSGKGEKQRTVYLDMECTKILQKYLKNERNKLNYGAHVNSPYVFISRKSDKLSTSGINRIFKRYNKKIHPHELRHWFCTNGLEQDGKLHEIAYFAGHKSVETTFKYTRPTKNNLKRKVNGFIGKIT